VSKTIEIEDLTTDLTDVRKVQLGRLSATAILDRLRPAESAKIPVAAFNASL
jgi:hypothetical protein